MARTIDDLMQTPGAGMAAMPTMPMMSMGTPSPADLSAAAAAGLGAARQYQTNPFSTPGLVNFPTPQQMMPAQFGMFRQAMTPPPPALGTTPGVTGMFHSPANMAVQAELGMTSGFLNPATAGQNFAAGRLQSWGQHYGRHLGSALGMVGGAAVSGGGLMGWGATIGGMAGDYLGGMVQHIPGLNWMHRQMYGGAAQDLMMMSNLQHRTMGRLFLNEEQAGLGGRGMNMQSAMSLGRRLTSMSEGSGGTFNRMDMLNMTQAAGDMGLLDAANNIEQIGDTIGKLMKVVGKMAKLTGDPDFKNNLRELANLRNAGMTIEQAVGAVADMGSYARAAGMTRTQLMESGGARGMAMFASMGLSPGAGMAVGGYGTAHGRMMAGAFSPLQQSLIGDTGQRIAESQAAFVGGTARLLVPGMLGVGEGGQITIDPAKARQMASPGAMNQLQSTLGRGQGNMYAVAQEISQKTGRQFQDVLAEIMGRMPEFQSMMAQQLGPEGIQRMQMNTFAGMINTLGPGSSWQAAMLTSGGDVNQARILMKQASDPSYYERQRQLYRQEIKDLQLEAAQEGRAARVQREEAMAESRRAHRRAAVSEGVFEAFGVAGRGLGMPGLGGFAREMADLPRQISHGWSERNIAEANREMRSLQESADAAKGIRRLYTGYQDPELLRRTRKRMEGLVTGGDLVTGAGTQEMEFTDEGGVRFTGDMGEVTEGETEAFYTSRGFGGLGKTAMDFAGGINRAAEWLGVGRARGARAMFNAVVRRENREIARTAQSLQEAKNLSFEDVAEMRKRMTNALEGEGGKSGAALTARIMTVVKNSAARMGREGLALKTEHIEQAAIGALEGEMGPERARNFVKRNSKGLAQAIFADIRLTGTPEAKAAVLTSGDAEWHRNQAAIGGAQKHIDTMREEQRAVLTQLGVLEGSWQREGILDSPKFVAGQMSAGGEEERAITAFAKLTAEEQADIIALAEGGEEARAQIEGEGRAADVKKAMQFFSQHGGTEGFAGKFGQAVGRLAGGTREERIQKLTAAMAGKGSKALQSALGERVRGATVAGGRVGGGQSAFDIRGGGAASEGKQEEIAKKKMELEMLEKMHAMFVGEGGIAPELQNAAENLNRSTVRLANVLSTRGAPPYIPPGSEGKESGTGGTV